MDWAPLIPVIAIAVWILSSLLGKKEDENKAQGPRPGGREPGAAPGRGSSDIDRFLQEIQRRRRQSEERQEPKPPAPVPIPARRPEAAPQRERRRPRPVPVADEPPRRRPAMEQTPPRRQEAEPVVVLLESTPPPPPAPAWSQLRPVKPVPPVDFPRTDAPMPKPPAPPAAALPAVVVDRARSVSPAVAQLLALLRTSQSLQTAVLLREVLDAPRCRRGVRDGSRQ